MWQIIFIKPFLNLNKVSYTLLVYVRFLNSKLYDQSIKIITFNVFIKFYVSNIHKFLQFVLNKSYLSTLQLIERKKKALEKFSLGSWCKKKPFGYRVISSDTV